MRCPRFTAPSSCSGSGLTCVSGKVTGLCVGINSPEARTAALTLFVHSQGLAQQQLDWLDIADDWAIDGTVFVVCCVGADGVSAHVSAGCLVPTI